MLSFHYHISQEVNSHLFWFGFFFWCSVWPKVGSYLLFLHWCFVYTVNLLWMLMKKQRQCFCNANAAHPYPPSTRALTEKPRVWHLDGLWNATNRDLQFCWNNTAYILFMIQILGLSGVLLAAQLLPFASCKIQLFFEGGIHCLSQVGFFVCLFLLMYSGALQMNESSWQLEPQVHRSASACGLLCRFH